MKAKVVGFCSEGGYVYCRGCLAEAIKAGVEPVNLVLPEALWSDEAEEWADNGAQCFDCGATIFPDESAISKANGREV